MVMLCMLALVDLAECSPKSRIHLGLERNAVYGIRVDAGSAEMVCVPQTASNLLAVVLPLALVGGALCVLMVLLCGHKQLFNDFRRWRVHMLKSR